MQLVWAVEGETEVYGQLLELVERNVEGLEEQLDDEKI